MKRADARTAGRAVRVASSLALLLTVALGAPALASATSEPPAEEPPEVGVIDGAVVAVAPPPVPPTTVVVAVGEPPVPPTTVVVAVGQPPVPPTTVVVAVGEPPVPPKSSPGPILTPVPIANRPAADPVLPQVKVSEAARVVTAALGVLSSVV